MTLEDKNFVEKHFIDWHRCEKRYTITQSFGQLNTGKKI